jgi:anti-anti-sigma regulatory factor
MIQNGPVVVKQLPESSERHRRKQFLAEVKQLARQSYRAQLIIDLPANKKICTETLELLLSCVEHVERSEGRVSVAGASPEAAVIMELTQLTSVINVFPSVSDAAGIDKPYQLDSLDRSDTQHMAA